MVVDVERTFDVGAPVEAVWEILSDPDKRAQAISVVQSYEQEGDEYVWQLALPIPVINGTVAVRTWDVDTDPPTFVQFRGRSRVMQVTGEHEITPTEDGARVRNRFVVDGRVPGVERFFKRNVDDEIRNILEAISDHAGVDRVE